MIKRRKEIRHKPHDETLFFRPLEPSMTIKKGTYLWTVTCTGHNTVIIGSDFAETFARACEYFCK